MPDTAHLAAIDTVLAIILMMALIFRVGALRGRYKIEAPAMSGHPAFEQANRTHMNTIESFVLFLPLLWLATTFFGGEIPFWVGLGWNVARVLYAVGYAQTNVNLRAPGSGLSFLCLIGLLVLTIIGLVH